MEQRRDFFRKQLEKFVVDEYNTYLMRIPREKREDSGVGDITAGSDASSLARDKELFYEFVEKNLPPVPVFSIYQSVKAANDGLLEKCNDMAKNQQGALIPSKEKLLFDKPNIMPETKELNKSSTSSEQKEKPITRANQLLARIRAKQQETEQQSKRNHEKQSDVSSSSCLNTKEKARIISIIDCLNFIFGIEKKTVLPLLTAVSKLVDSLPTFLSPIEVQQLIVKLVSVAPEYFSIENIAEDGPNSSGSVITDCSLPNKNILFPNANNPTAIAHAASQEAKIVSTSILRINRKYSAAAIKSKIQAL
ncbi:hypothetical protein BB561_003383 [Smittium simulii]|uniref:DNA replication factor Cdt1 C-terminal domain-containing protein n=1 Tax=Smittium simulii TaxID=133385 RepID=A0A2T9YLM6_9FUNG|nr:hypothetical protein BB561_003383 [Smittium simulii]